MSSNRREISDSSTWPQPAGMSAGQSAGPREPHSAMSGLSGNI